MAESVMLDTNVFGRPFDDLNQGRIFKEAVASFHIFSLAALGFIKIICSDVLFAELELIRDKPKRDLILFLARGVCTGKIKLDQEVIKLADILFPLAGDYMDSLHISSAAIGNCRYFVTCDDDIIREGEGLETHLKQSGYSVYIRNPGGFLGEMKGVL